MKRIAASLHPTLDSGQFFLAGPFPPAEGNGRPWWILAECELVKS